MLTRWNDFGRFGRLATPNYAAFDSFDELRREMNRLFFDFERGWPPNEAESLWPRTSFEDTGTALVLRAELPGLEQKELELSVDENNVTLKGERKDVAPEGYSVHRKERGAYRFTRAFALPTKVDAEKAEAVLKNGVLTITLPKAKEVQPRKVSVRGS